MQEYRLAYSTKQSPVRTLIIDSKPRWKAEWELSGLRTSHTRRYSKWGHGSGVIRGSYVLSRQQSIGTELDRVWGLGGTIAIAQSEREEDWGYLSDVATTFYERYGTHSPRLLFVDELADFFKWRSLGDIFQRVSRNGRERDVALVAGSQRPRKIPVELMTEMSRLCMFKLFYREDIKHIYDFGIPMTTLMPSGHTFYMYDRELDLQPPSNGYYRLNLKAA